MTAKTVPAPDITQQVNDLLRTEPRLKAAGALIDRVSVVLKLAPKDPPPRARPRTAARPSAARPTLVTLASRFVS